jgi:hypothetical protein
LKLYIDTNKYLDFYRTTEQKIEAFEQLHQQSQHIVFPEQTFNEFSRNRGNILASMIDAFSKPINSLNPVTTAMIRKLEEFKEFEGVFKALKTSALKVLEALNQISDDITKDPVYENVKKLYEKTEQILTTTEIIENAKTRQMLGNPPGTHDVTIGDEVIWESLLANVNDDLIIVSKDKSFSKNRQYLSAEFHEKTGHCLRIFEKLDEAIKMLGEAPSEAVTEFEKETESLPSSVNIVVPSAHAYASSLIPTVKGYIHPAAGNSIGMSCPHCSSNGPWNGAVCLTCGQRSESYLD